MPGKKPASAAEIFTKEGITGINRTFGTNTGFPFTVIYGIWYQCPVQAVYKGRAKKGDTREHDESERVTSPEIIQYITHRPQHHAS
ncbi:Uncharacterised protein [Escherichia coli]|uniref:Uncharacterized protein n=1 Tax=Escherichia coli TaxID=562 RepID=A0A376L404_ECOLX|nr:Uncharacterised protein [Escherichia coli]